MVRVKNFLSIFAKKAQSNLVLVLVLVQESKGPYYVKQQAASALLKKMVLFINLLGKELTQKIE